MNSTELLTIRLYNQLLSTHEMKAPHEIVSRMGAMQAQALEMIGSDFIQETINGRECWMRNDIRTPLPGQESALLLAPFDEFVVSYKDRSEMIAAEQYSKVMTKKIVALFQPEIERLEKFYTLV